MGSHLSGVSIREVVTSSHGFRRPKDGSRITEQICTGEAGPEEAKIILIMVSSFLKSRAFRQWSSDMILSCRKDLSGSRQKGLISNSEMSSACSCAL